MCGRPEEHDVDDVRHSGRGSQDGSWDGVDAERREGHGKAREGMEGRRINQK